jgi:hypothetical protein
MCCLLLRRLEQHKAIVIYRHLPEMVWAKPNMSVKSPRTNAPSQSNALLIDRFATARKYRSAASLS